MSFVGLVLEADAGSAKNRFIGGNAIVAKPLLPPVVGRVYPVLMGQVPRFQPATEPSFDLGNALGARHWSEVRLKQPVFLKTFPPAAAAADRDVGIAAAQIAKFVAGRHPDGKIGMLHLERAEPPRQPGVGEGVRGGDGQERFVLLPVAGEGRFDRIERRGQGRKQALPKRGQASAPFLANEQG